MCDERRDLEDFQGDVGQVQPRWGWGVAGDDLPGASVQSWPQEPGLGGQ